MKNLMRHCWIGILRVATILRIIIILVCILCFIGLVWSVLSCGVETGEWLSLSMIGNYAIGIGFIVGILIMHVLGKQIKMRIEITKCFLELEREDKLRKKQQKLLEPKLGKGLYTSTCYDEELAHNESIRTFHVQRTSHNPKEEMAALIGMRAVKKQIEKIEAKLNYEKLLNSRSSGASLHMRFVGGPGTGKTTVGRIMAGILYQAKQIPEDKYVEINGNDLVGEYMGQTPLVVKDAFRQAAGGVLFIDEVYALANIAQNGNGGYGNEAVTQLLTLLERNVEGTVVIVAGYRNEMDAFFKMNPGLPSRIPNAIEFPDYSPLELTQIAERMLAAKGHTLTQDAAQKITEIAGEKINWCKTLQTPFGNARYIRNVVEELHQEHALNYQNRVVKDHAICMEDIDEGTLLNLD